MLTNSLTLLKGSRRDKLVLISDMLQHAAKGVCKTELMYKVGLSSAQLDKYIPELVRSELLEIQNHRSKPLYRTTAKGKNYLSAFDRLVRLLN